MPRVDNLSKVNHLGRARRDDNAAARRLLAAINRKANTEAVLRANGMEPTVIDALAEVNRRLDEIERDLEAKR